MVSMSPAKLRNIIANSNFPLGLISHIYFLEFLKTVFISVMCWVASHNSPSRMSSSSMIVTLTNVHHMRLMRLKSAYCMFTTAASMAANCTLKWEQLWQWKKGRRPQRSSTLHLRLHLRLPRPNASMSCCGGLLWVSSCKRWCCKPKSVRPNRIKADAHDTAFYYAWRREPG